MLVYGLAASAVGILFILIPVVIHSGVSIVQQKSDQKINKKMFWENISGYRVAWRFNLSASQFQSGD